jgi:hypothetical protein
MFMAKVLLTGRIQRMRIGGAVSKDITVTSGVPQGSLFGPLCFIWFVNRMSMNFEYVHDMKLFLPVKGS